MHSTLLVLHSVIRYFVLIMLIVLVFKSLAGWMGKAAYTPADNKISLFTLIFTHTQFLLGVLLYFVSPFVQFSSETMKDPFLRYWTVEHVTVMLIAVVLITVARSTSKKIADGVARHKRLFMLNVIALVIILAGIGMSGRGFFGISA
jgi:Na+/citrate or Na+/malate symporter